MAIASALASRRALVAQALTRSQRSRAARRAHGMQVPKGPIVSYAAALQKWLGGIQEETRRALFPLLADFSTAHNPGALNAPQPRQDAAPKLAGNLADAFTTVRVRVAANASGVLSAGPGGGIVTLADNAAARVNTFNAVEIKRLIGIDPRQSPGVSGAIEAFRAENVSLITSIPETMLDQVESVLSENFGLRAEELAKLIEERFDVAKSRANLIARDQTLKLNGQLTKYRQVDAGIEAYIWTTSNDERVRETHAALEGRTIRWDDPPAETGHPGDDINCRCTAYPAPLEDEDSDESTDESSDDSEPAEEEPDEG